MTDVFEKAVAELNLDRSGWQLVKFGDLAIQQKQSVDRENTELTRYVKGEHMYSEDIHLREWGELTDEYLGPAFIRKFEEGDILYGSRRTYLRKVVIAPFEGITSNTTFVIKANEEKIDKRLLPFIMLSEGFSQHSIKNSKGSVNPYVNFKDLAGYEFLLPTRREQKELVNLLLSLDDSKQAKLSLSNKLNTLMSATLAAYFSYRNTEESNEKHKTELGWIPNSWEVVEQHKVAKFINGRAYKKTEWEEVGVPVIRLQNLTGTGEKYYYSNLDLPEHQYCEEGDLLYMWSATFGAKFWHGSKAIFHYHIWKIECNEERILKRFMFYNLEEITRRMMREVSGSTMPHITKSGMEKLKIVLPTIEFQKVAVKELDLISVAINDIEKSLTEFNKLYKSILNRIF